MRTMVETGGLYKIRLPNQMTPWCYTEVAMFLKSITKPVARLQMSRPIAKELSDWISLVWNMGVDLE